MFNFREDKVMAILKKGLLAFLLLAIFACKQNNNRTDNNAKPDSVYKPVYANRFNVKYFKDHKQIEIVHPWDTTAVPLVTLLSDDPAFLEKHPSAIKIPVKKWVSVTSTQISYAHKLNVTDKLVGVAEPQYISNSKVKTGLEDGSIRNIGTAFAPGVELLLALNPDMMMVSPFKEDFYGPLRSVGIKMVTNSSYLENTPLGRVEWLVYVAAFFNKEQEAIKVVNEIADRYNAVKELTINLKDKPSVFTGKAYQGVWYSPAAESYNANFMKDAGVDYVFKDRHGTGSLNYDYETVYEAAGHADFWSLLVNYNGAYNYTALEDEDNRYADFDAFKSRSVIYSNSRNSMIYEKGLLEPDVVLSDLVKLFHPKLLLNYKPVYYHKLTKE